ncbi:MAG: ATP-binding protein [Methanothrix sp.]|nr:MAG: ATP-binding protein [Methanothrix sp.]
MQEITAQEIIVPAKKDQIPVVTEFVEALMNSRGFDPQKTLEVMLAVEEACTNVALYAYAGKDGNQEGLMRIAAGIAHGKHRGMKLTIEDWGIPFDPTKHIKPISDAGAEERPIGGLGIHLIKSYVDDIKYKHIDGKNVLTLIKYE